jgi:hypothetical protein
MALDAWCVDAWAVRDGAAFASRREAEAREAENTVFIAVPDLEPVPVGRRSTALSATRRNFQTGLRNLDGTEIAFESLEQIAELVRRGFLAAGLGPGGSAVPTPGGRPPPEGDGEKRETPDRPQGGGAEHYERMIERTETHDREWHRGPDPVAKSLERVANAAASPWRTESRDSELIAPLLTLITAYADSITIDWEWRVEQRPDPFDMKMLVDWYEALCAIGVWMGGQEMHSFLSEHPCHVGRRLWDFRGPPWPGPWLSEVAGLPRQHLLAYAPCPRRSRRIEWVPGLRRLADKVTLPMCIGTYFDGNRHLPELAPSILGAILLTSGGFPSAVVTRTQFAESRLATALRWLAREVPALALPGDAEYLVDDYAWSRVDGRPSGALPENRFR